MASKRRRQARTAASTADKYQLYLASVQAPDVDVAFFERVYRKEFGRPAGLLREDFCGTAAVCYEWVKNRPRHRALGVDFDPKPLAWGVAHLRSGLRPSDARRVELIRDDVRVVQGPKADIVAAQNFSYMTFQTREALREYFQAARANLKGRGLLILDAMGGPEVIEEEREETTRFKGFTYVWEQARFDPITHRCRFHIHFHFRDGSKMRRAFTYDWRLWTLPEIQELLLEAGFRRADVYWEDTDSETGEGNGTYRRRASAESDDAWVAYIVGVK